MSQPTRQLTDFSLSPRTLNVFALALVFLLAVSGLANAQMQVLPEITTIAGDGTAGSAGDGSAASNAELNAPSRIAFDNAGNMYIADTANNRIRVVAVSNGAISTVAGNGTAGYSGDSGQAASAELNGPKGVAVDNAGNLFIADTGNNVIRKVSTVGIITTVAGTGTAGYTGDTGPATSAELNQPAYVSLDLSGDLYIADTGNNVIREVNGGTISTVAGNGTAGFSGDSGPATSAELNGPMGVVVNTAGYIYIADTGNNRVRKINSSLNISTIAGNGTAGYSGDGGAGTSAELRAPSGLTLDNASNVYIADSLNNVVRMLNGGTAIITTVAGNGTAGYTGDSGAAPAAELSGAADVALSNINNLYVADAGNNVVRKVQTNGSFSAASVGALGLTQDFFLRTTSAETITSILAQTSQGSKQEFTVGTITGCTVNGVTSNASGTICTVPVTFTPAYPAQRNVPLQVVAGGGSVNFGLIGTGVAPLAALLPGTISTVAGNGTAGYSGNSGVATSAELDNPSRIVVDSAGNLYIADTVNNVVRKVTYSTGLISTVAGTGTPGSTGDGNAATLAKLHAPKGLGIDHAGNLYIADYENCKVREVNAATGIITTVAGNGICGYSGDGGLAINAELNSPASDIAFDGPGNFYFADAANNVIRKVYASTGVIATVAGNGTAGYTGDSGPAGSAELSNPAGVALDNSGNLYIADSANHVIRSVNASTDVISTFAGNGTSGYSNGSAATTAELSTPSSLVLDSAGNLYIADSGNNAIRLVNIQTGDMITVAGTSVSGYTGDGGAATSAKLDGATDIALDNPGNLIIADAGNNVIRKVDITQSQSSFTTTTYGATTSENITLSNFGNAPLVVAPPVSGNNPSPSGSFSADSSSTCPVVSSTGSQQSLAAGLSCTYVLDFDPNGVGTLTGGVVITDNSLGVTGTTQTMNGTGPGTAANTTSVLSPTSNPAQYGQARVNATVAPTLGSAVPTGTVQFSADSVQVGSPVTVNGSGIASYLFTTLVPGGHSITAVYTPGSGDFNGSSASSLSLTVVPATLTATIQGNPTKVYNGTTSATLAPGNFAITGFANGDGAIVTQTAGTYAAATAGTETVTATLSPSNLTATGSTMFPNYTLPTTASGPGTISKAGTATSLSASASSVHPGQSVTLTAMVSASAGTPTSNVQFFDGTTALGTSALSSGVATYVANLGAGSTHTITAVYGGDTDFAVSTSSAVSVAVAAQDFTFAVASGGSSSQTVSLGGSATYQLLAAPVYTAFPGTVTFTLTGLPTGATYTFSPATVPGSGGSTTTTLTVHGPSTARLEGIKLRRGVEPMLLGFLLLPLAGSRRIRNWGRRKSLRGLFGLALLFCLAGLIGLNACGGSSGGGSSTQPPQSQSYTLTATATSGQTAHNVTLTLVVQQ